jgi:hypothetical protein
MTNKLVSFPYKGFAWDSALAVLTLNPAEAKTLTVLTAILQLVDYPSSFYSQDITSTNTIEVQAPATAIQPLFIASQTLNADIEQEVILTLSNIIGV